MNVLGHYDVSEQREIVARSNFTQNLEKEMPRRLRTQQRQATITTASDEVQLAEAVTASQALRHFENPNPLYPEGFGTPHGSRN
jgi:hypothetical protein